MLIFRLLSEYFWAVAIIVSALNIFGLRQNGKRLFAEDAEELDKFNKFISRFGFWLLFPWVVMGIGVEVGGVETIWHFFRPREGNFFVIVWWAGLYSWWLYTLYWLIFAGGAEKLVKYQVVYYRSFGKSGPVKSPLKIKLLVGVMILVLFIVSISVWFKDMPLPEF